MALIHTARRAIKRFYEQGFFAGNGKTPVEQALYTILDEDLSETFAFDKLITFPVLIQVRKPGQESVTRLFSPGSGTVYELPIIGIKTPLGEQFDGLTMAGFEPTASWVSQNLGAFRRIARQHINDTMLTKAKACWSPIFDGKFIAPSIGGGSFEIDFNRDSSLNLTEDYTSTDVFLSLTDAYAALLPFGVPKGNLIAVFGANFLAALQSSDLFLQRLQQTQGSLGFTQLIPESLGGSDINIMGRVNIPGTAFPCWIASYDPPSGVKEAIDSTSTTPIIDPDQMAMFPIDSERFLVRRGLTVNDENGNKDRVVGEVSVDSWIEMGDPIVEMIRSQAREVYVPANQNHYARIIATLPEVATSFSAEQLSAAAKQQLAAGAKEKPVSPEQLSLAKKIVATAKRLSKEKPVSTEYLDESEKDSEVAK